VAHVERSDADLRRGGRRHGRAAGAAGVSLASRTSLPLRRDGHTKVYGGRSEEVMRPHARLMEEPAQIADCVTQQRPCSGPALCSDEHRTWQVYHAQSRFSLRCVPHADSGQPHAAGFELAGFRDRVRRLLPRCFGYLLLCWIVHSRYASSS
jgi:hypothetical protein